MRLYLQRLQTHNNYHAGGQATVAPGFRIVAALLFIVMGYTSHAGVDAARVSRNCELGPGWEHVVRMSCACRDHSSDHHEHIPGELVL